MEDNKTVKIKALQNGPLQVSGEINLIGSDGKPLDQDGNVFLCRCGHSGNKPFCDGSHQKHGFRDK